MKSFFLLVLFCTSIFFQSHAQTTEKLIGNWVTSGNNVFFYEFKESGKLLINDFGEKLQKNTWRIENDTILFMTNESKPREYGSNIVEIDSLEMILSFEKVARFLTFYRVIPIENIAVKLTKAKFTNKNFKLESNEGKSICSISFHDDGTCLMSEIALTEEIKTYNSRWKIVEKAGNQFLYLNDFEIMMVTEESKDTKSFTFLTYGFLKSQFEIESVKLIWMDDVIKE